MSESQTLIDDMTGVDDYPPQRVAYDAYEALMGAVNACELTTAEMETILDAMMIMLEKSK